MGLLGHISSENREELKRENRILGRPGISPIFRHVKKENKTYLVFFIDQEDSDVVCKRMSGERLKQFILERNDGQDSLAIVEGTLLKNFNSKIDLNRL